MTLLGSTIDAYTQAMTYGVGALAMVAIGMSRRRLEWRRPEKKQRHWPWHWWSSGA